MLKGGERVGQLVRRRLSSYCCIPRLIYPIRSSFILLLSFPTIPSSKASLFDWFYQFWTQHKRRDIHIAWTTLAQTEWMFQDRSACSWAGTGLCRSKSEDLDFLHLLSKRSSSSPLIPSHYPQLTQKDVWRVVHKMPSTSWYYVRRNSYLARIER